MNKKKINKAGFAVAALKKKLQMKENRILCLLEKIQELELKIHSMEKNQK